MEPLNIPEIEVQETKTGHRIKEEPFIRQMKHVPLLPTLMEEEWSGALHCLAVTNVEDIWVTMADGHRTPVMYTEKRLAIAPNNLPMVSLIFSWQLDAAESAWIVYQTTRQFNLTYLMTRRCPTVHWSKLVELAKASLCLKNMR